MKLTLNVSDAVGAALAAEAERVERALPEHAVNMMTVTPPAAPLVRTGAEMVRYLTDVGFIGSLPPDTDPVARSRELRAQSERRYRPGTVDAAP